MAGQEERLAMDVALPSEDDVEALLDAFLHARLSASTAWKPERLALLKNLFSVLVTNPQDGNYNIGMYGGLLLRESPIKEA